MDEIITTTQSSRLLMWEYGDDGLDGKVSHRKTWCTICIDGVRDMCIRRDMKGLKFNALG